jgi:hypothetical protein
MPGLTGLRADVGAARTDLRWVNILETASLRLWTVFAVVKWTLRPTEAPARLWAAGPFLLAFPMDHGRQRSQKVLALAKDAGLHGYIAR